jgi:hypothetical protein
LLRQGRLGAAEKLYGKALSIARERTKYRLKPWRSPSARFGSMAVDPRLARERSRAG